MIRNLIMKGQLSVSIGIIIFSTNEINSSEIKMYLLASISVWQPSMHFLAELL